MSVSGEDEILTLEPLMDAVREGVESRGWALSGMQKTTSHEFEGRWEGESTRSAYLFFHPGDGRDDVSIDVYLDETSRGLTGNLALVVDLLPLGNLESPAEAIRTLGSVASSVLPEGYRSPLTLRLRLERADEDPAGAETEIRFKLRIPRRSISAGHVEIRRLAATTVESFERILASEELRKYEPNG